MFKPTVDTWRVEALTRLDAAGDRDADTLFREVGEWSEKTFGTTAERGPVGPLKHLVLEVGVELLGIEKRTVQRVLDTAPKDPPNCRDIGELADVLILLDDATRRAGHTWGDLVTAAGFKMEVNRTRVYPKPGAGEVSEHVRTPAEARAKEVLLLARADTGYGELWSESFRANPASPDALLNALQAITENRHIEGSDVRSLSLHAVDEKPVWEFSRAEIEKLDSELE